MQKGNPSMSVFQQYQELKESHEDCLLLFRLGEFYECFYDDAKQASEALNITLTQKGKKENEAPMCGIPAKAQEIYLSRLIQKGFKVALCDQTPDHQESCGKLMKREVIRILTPGTLVEDTLLAAKKNHYLLALTYSAGMWGMAWADISTGIFWVSQAPQEKLKALVDQINPQEIVLPKNHASLPGDQSFLDERCVSHLSDYAFDPCNGQALLEQMFEPMSLHSVLNHPAEWAACDGLLNYLLRTQKGKMPSLLQPRSFLGSQALQISSDTRKHLELFQTTEGEEEKSFLHQLDRTVTAAGGRLLRSRLLEPLTDVLAIQKRLHSVSWMLSQQEVRNRIRSLLKQWPDVERIIARLQMKRASPKDMIHLKQGLDALITLLKTSSPAAWIGLDPLFWSAIPHESLCASLKHFLPEETPSSWKDHGAIDPESHPELKKHSESIRKHENVLAQLQKHYRETLGIGTLRVKTQGQGDSLYAFVEVSKSQTSKIPFHFSIRQMLTDSVRYQTAELLVWENEWRSLNQAIRTLQEDIFQTLFEQIQKEIPALRETAQKIAELDVICALAQWSEETQSIMPLVDDSHIFDIRDARHPGIEALLKQKGQDFVTNGCCLTPENPAWVITGPNMSGKSTFLRQEALMVILAQMGCFVPASFAHIGIVDGIYSRMGAHDRPTRGQSTFMVEMCEMAELLKRATSKSLVIIDELGRGTSPAEGLALAQACFENLLEDRGCRMLFSTHYVEIGRLVDTLSKAQNYHFQVLETQEGLSFSHQLVPGYAQHSYALHVAHQAGISEDILRRAASLLETVSSSGPLR